MMIPYFPDVFNGELYDGPAVMGDLAVPAASVHLPEHGQGVGVATELRQGTRNKGNG